MKWLKRLALVLVIVVVAGIALAIGTARRTERPVGFQVVRVDSPGGPVAVALWYPTSGTPWPTTFLGGQLLSVARNGPVAGERLPVVLISHGNGGSALSHVDLAMELASSGYVVAAPTHAGDNYADQSRQSSPALFSQRAQQMRSTLDHVLGPWSGASHVDRDRVGAFGMSAGAFTVLTLAGGVPRMAAIPEHCSRTPEFICTAFAQVGSPLLAGAQGAGHFSSDPRIKAVVLAAPGLGFTFAPDGLSGVRVPVQLWSGDRDETVPFASNAGIVAAGLGDRVEAHRIAGATHLSFLAPCGLMQPPALCADPKGFDRAAAHTAMNAEVIRFFDSHLPASAIAR
ncbi:alpha/beta hydrolase family protein [Lysobacter yangpyeongensis]|uniref:Alpha/beta hydrolase family protein n=1 Tax=Lysobacter yangpyeongensis TaxID=346182 RepID=A0ABW0SIR5_9GAMM